MTVACARNESFRSNHTESRELKQSFDNRRIWDETQLVESIDPILAGRRGRRGRTILMDRSQSLERTWQGRGTGRGGGGRRRIRGSCSSRGRGREQPLHDRSMDRREIRHLGGARGERCGRADRSKRRASGRVDSRLPSVAPDPRHGRHATGEHESAA